MLKRLHSYQNKLLKYGTSAGAEAGWDTRGRGRKGKDEGGSGKGRGKKEAYDENEARNRYPRAMSMNELYKAHDQIKEMKATIRENENEKNPVRNVKELQNEIDKINETRVEPGRESSHDLTIYKMPGFVKEDGIQSAYIGKPNSCMCGCAGNYYYPSAGVKEAGKDRGYAIGKDEISNAKVDRIYNKMEKHAGESGIEVIFGGSRSKGDIYTSIIGSKQYTIYAKGKKAEKALQSEAITKQEAVVEVTIDTGAEDNDDDLFTFDDKNTAEHNEQMSGKTKKDIMIEGGGSEVAEESPE
jgi:hypothetical protein